MYIRVLKCPLKSGDVTLKFTVCKSYRCKTSGKALYFSRYLTSIRASQLADTKNPDYRRKFWLKYNLALDKLAVPRDSDIAELLKIGIFATWERLGYPC